MGKREDDQAHQYPWQGIGRRIRRFLFITASALIIAGGLIGARWWYVNQLPESAIPRIPEVVLPRENGYTELATAGTHIVRNKEISSALVRHPSPGWKEHIYTATERQQLLSENASALTEARHALTIPSTAIPLRDARQRWPELTKDRSLARLFSLDGSVAEENKQYGRAANAYLDAIALNDKVSNGGGLIHKLVGIACAAIGRRPLVPLADKLSAPEARQAASRLETIMAGHVPMASTFEQEKWSTQATLVAAFRKQSIYDFIQSEMTAGEAVADLFSTIQGQEQQDKTFADNIRATGTNIFLFFVSLGSTKTEILQSNAAFRDHLIEISKHPYDPLTEPSRQADTAQPLLPKDILNQILLPVFAQAQHKDRDAQAQDALLLTKLAIRAYHQEQGVYPSSLGELVQAKILKDLPHDPFGKSETTPLRYRLLTRERYLLYSVGPDGKDDSGTPIDNRDSNGRQKRWTEATSRGDFVLGANLY